MATARKTTSTPKAPAKAPPHTPAKKTAKAAAQPARRKSNAVDAPKPVVPGLAPASKALPAKLKTPSYIVKAEKAKAKKPKLVRDSFTIPKSEYEVIGALKLRAGQLGQAPKKSELLRAGLKALAAMDDQALKASIAAVPSIKTGRPAA